MHRVSLGLSKCIALALGPCVAASLLVGCSEPATSDGASTDDTQGGTTSTGDAPADVSTGSSDGGQETTSEPDTDTEDTGEPLEPVRMEIFQEVVFYDGYAETVDEPVPAGAIRHNNALYATRLSEGQLDSIQSTLTMEVYVGALCDNYDRLGHVYISFVPEGSETYEPSEVTRFEVARFVTPFMNMNINPTIVPFNYDLADLVPLLTNEQLRDGNDVWIELSVFGVPYAANTEISGCSGRNDTSRGALYLNTDSKADATEFGFALPLAVNEAFNNHQRGASDAVGTTTKTVEFTLDADTTETQLVLITSNHGANSGGEEYNRREHFIYVDGDQVHTYTPGRTTCEPFRMYNTQGNGIYGPTPRTDEEWQSFSNWCPGDVIDTRIIELGAMTAGTHEFVIDVPDALFANGEGNFPFSLYVQGS